MTKQSVKAPVPLVLLMVAFVVLLYKISPLYIGIMNSSLTEVTGLNMNDYFEELNTSDSVTYS